MVMARLRSDEGFTLTELIVVVSLIGFVISAAYGAHYVVARGAETSERQAFMSREVGAPLEFAERVLCQQWNIDKAYPGVTPYRVKMQADIDTDDVTEEYVIEATADNTLVIESREGDAPFRTAVWSEHNRNVAVGTPLLRFFRQDGSEIPAADFAEVYSYAYSAEVQIVTEYGGKQLSSTRRVTFRNR